MATPVYCRDIYAFLSIRGRINFLQLARYGKYHESTYRMGFERDFDFFNLQYFIGGAILWSELYPGFDPTYLNKSGKHTRESVTFIAEQPESISGAWK
ncbi:MAG: hypothetical protein IPL46_00575 [Saprospiraceae bacterium]|nr:hypothetical protein [Saprospiraceae bacterium]